MTSATGCLRLIGDRKRQNGLHLFCQEGKQFDTAVRKVTRKILKVYELTEKNIRNNKKKLTKNV